MIIKISEFFKLDEVEFTEDELDAVLERKVGVEMRNGKKMYDLADSIEVLASILKSDFQNKSNEELKNQLKWILNDCYKLNRLIEEVEE